MGPDTAVRIYIKSARFPSNHLEEKFSWVNFEFISVHHTSDYSISQYVTEMAGNFLTILSDNSNYNMVNFPPKHSK